MSLYKRGGAWWYDFKLDGVRIRESSHLTSRSEAAKAEALLKAQLIQGRGEQVRPETAPKFYEFAQTEFAAWSENQHRDHPSTHQRYMRSIKVLIGAFGHLSLDRISAADVERFKITRGRQRRMNAREGRTVTPAAVNRDLAVLRILFNFAIRMKKAKTNPVVGVKFLPENNARMSVISFEEEVAYLHAASSTLRDIAIVILETGMRPGEVFDLRREDVNREYGFVQIPTGKTRFARRTIPLTRRALDVFSRRLSSVESEWLFPAMKNSSKPLASVAGPHEAALRLSGIKPPFRLYDLRHTALTRMAMAGIDLSTLRELAGHASIQITMRYVHPTPEHKMSAIKKLEGLREENAGKKKGADPATSSSWPSRNTSSA